MHFRSCIMLRFHSITTKNRLHLRNVYLKIYIQEHCVCLDEKRITMSECLGKGGVGATWGVRGGQVCYLKVVFFKGIYS